MSTSPWHTLKEHPIIIVFGFCAATVAATATVYEKLVVPYQLKVLEVQVSDLNRQLASIPITEKTIADRDKTIAKLQEQIVGLRQRAIELTRDNVFSPEDPYPKAFREVRIGDPFSKLEKVFPGRIKKDDPDNSYASAAVEDDFFFRTVTYYYDAQAKPPRVTMSLFQIKQDVPLHELVQASGISALERWSDEGAKGNVSALKKQLTERYGQGIVGKKDTLWKVRGLKLALRDSGTLLIDKR